MSPKQRKILSMVAGYAITPGATWPTIDDLIFRTGSTTSKQAMQHTLRELEMLGFINRTYELRDNRVNLVVKPTSEGLKMVEPVPL